MNHYTYLISNLNPLAKQKYYIGVRTCQCEPEDDNYLGSSKYLANDVQKLGYDMFEKLIIEQWESRNKAYEHEIWLHHSYNVATNPLFYNKSNATSAGFSVHFNQDAIAAIAKKNKENWKQKSNNEKDAHAAKTKVQWQNKSQIERDAIFKKVAASHKTNWKNKSQSEIEAHAAKFKNIWDNKTPDEKDVHANRTKEQWANRSESAKEKIAQKKSISVSNLRWYNDGVFNRRFVPSEAPAGFKIGRLPNRKI